MSQEQQLARLEAELEAERTKLEAAQAKVEQERTWINEQHLQLAAESHSASTFK